MKAISNIFAFLLSFPHYLVSASSFQRQTLTFLNTPSPRKDNGKSTSVCRDDRLISSIMQLNKPTTTFYTSLFPNERRMASDDTSFSTDTTADTTTSTSSTNGNNYYSATSNYLSSLEQSMNSTNDDTLKNKFNDNSNKKTSMQQRKSLQEKKKKLRRSAASSPVVTTLSTIPEFLSLVDDAPLDSLVVIKFHAKYCQLCNKVKLKYKKLANQYMQQTKKTQAPNTPPIISFAEMEVGTGINKQFGKRLNIPEFPYIQIYRNGCCVASFATGPVRNFTKIIEYTVNVELGMSPSDWDLFFERFDEEMTMGRMRLEQARQLADEL